MRRKRGTSTEWRELRAELSPEHVAAQAEAQRMRERVASVEAEGSISDAESEVLERLAAIRAAIAGASACRADRLPLARAALR